ncbi:MAG: purine-nucleoside phosphorylase [Ruminococcus sp.]|nr:purine-nucleoside phosphorylase [Ruminococcus sp.]
MSNSVYKKLENAYNCVRKKTNFVPQTAIVLGSGLGAFAEEKVDIDQTIDYSEIDGFPVSTVKGHKGRFVFGTVGGVNVVIMQGRVHYYEGYPMTDVVMPVRLMGMLGAKAVILTNASGAINRSFSAGDLMMVTDHIASFVPNPLIGENIDELGVRFPDMSSVYDKNLQKILLKSAQTLGISLKQGVYAQLTGPSYETPAEIKMLGTLGADVVGMSTAVEAIAANHAGIKVCAISCISNLAAGISPVKLTHEEVQKTADEVAPKFKALICEAVEEISDFLSTQQLSV